MARALIVGCGCRGRELGERLLAEGWTVRGTSRREEGLAAIAAAGIEGGVGGPERAGAVLEVVKDGAVLGVLLGGASGGEGGVGGVPGPRPARVVGNKGGKP